NNNMFKREVLRQLENWKADSSRKPLVLRGPRQVGKTTVVNEFGKLFDTGLVNYAAGVPIEVKSGINAHLRSLHSFIEQSVSDIAVRVWSGEYGINELVTPHKGKPFKLINLPFYMLGNLEQIVRDVKRS
ncbi:MAG: hypothetical protein IJ984_08360, partial [Prevotella sp.]|nr:hypothetical protein [Prevotella sp.]